MRVQQANLVTKDTLVWQKQPEHSHGHIAMHCTGSVLLGVSSSCVAICILSTIAIHFLMNV